MDRVQERDLIKAQMLELARRYAALYEADKAQPKRYVPASGKNIGAEELCNMIEASLDMNLTAGRFNDQFEKGLADKLGVNFVLTTNSGSSANLLAFTALTSPKLKERRLVKGDEVIAVAAGFPTTINPIIQNGMVPVFIDVELGTYNIDVSQIEAAITPKTKAIFLAHTLGNMYDITAIMDIARRHNLWVIEDTCDALGARWDGKYAGTFGHIATCSFYPAHHLTMGEGGAVLTSDFTLWKILRSLRDWGRDCWCNPGCDNTCHRRFEQQLGRLPAGYDHKYTYSHIGFNLKITDWQAAIGVAQLAKLDHFLQMRHEHAALLTQLLQDMQDLFILPQVDPRCESAWFGYLLTIKPEAGFTRRELTTYLEEHGIGTRLLFAGNALRQPSMTESDVVCRIGSDPKLLNSRELTEADFARLPQTEYIMEHTFWVGVAQNLTEYDIRKTAAVLHAFAGR